MVPLDGGRRDAFPFVAATFGWILTEMGRQPWIVQDLLKTADADSPEREHDEVAMQPRRVRAALPRSSGSSTSC